MVIVFPLYNIIYREHLMHSGHFFHVTLRDESLVCCWQFAYMRLHHKQKVPQILVHNQTVLSIGGIYLNSKASITCVSLDRLKFLITYLLKGLLLFLKLRERERERERDK